MRKWVWTGLAALVLGRLGIWAGQRNRSLSLCAELEHRQSLQKYTVLVGVPLQREGGRFALEGAVAELPTGRVPVPGWVWLDGRVARPGLGTGRKLSVFGPIRCRRAPRNPATGPGPGLSFSASGVKVRSSLASEPIGALSLLRESFRSGLSRALAPWPGLRALSLATWTGDAGALPASLRELYLEGGLLHILALSGQHVVVLAALLALVGKSALPLAARCGPKVLRGLAAGGKNRLLIAAAGLALVSDGLAPLRRSLSMVIFFEGLGRRRFFVKPLSLLAGSAAAALLVDPALVESPSFLLSVAATAFVGRMVGYSRLAWLMPVLTGPMSALFFGKVAWLAPVGNFLLGGIWAVLWLPLGFVAPALPRGAADNAERLWIGFLALQQRAAQWAPLAYGPVWRPSVLEAAAWETLLVICCLPWLRARRLEWGAIT